LSIEKIMDLIKNSNIPMINNDILSINFGLIENALSEFFDKDTIDKVINCLYQNTHVISVLEIADFWEWVRPMKSLEDEFMENENNNGPRVIGHIIETRPDRISKMTLTEYRDVFEVTRIQMGIQQVNDRILKIINRGHKNNASVLAIKKGRDACYKIDGHLMPDLPGATLNDDINMFKEVFCGDQMQLDYVKLYICLDVIYTGVREWKQRAYNMINEGRKEEVLMIQKMMQDGDFVGLKKLALDNGKSALRDIYVWLPNSEEHYDDFVEKVLLQALTWIPPWVRIARLQRDFPPANERNKELGFVSEHVKSNQQQICMDMLREKGLICYDIRSREPKDIVFKNLENRAKLYIRCYRANEGTEFYISVEIPRNDNDINNAYLLGHCRLRITDYDMQRTDLSTWQKNSPSWYLDEFRNQPTGKIRELHVYGDVNAVNHNDQANSQHKGIGTFLMCVAENICHSMGIRKMAVISGNSVRLFYENKLGYQKSTQRGKYMIKHINDLPKMTLFKNNYSFEIIEKCVKGFDIISNHYNISTFNKDVLTYHNYKHINEAQLIVVNPNIIFEEKIMTFEKKINMKIIYAFFLFITFLIYLIYF